MNLKICQVRRISKIGKYLDTVQDFAEVLVETGGKQIKKQGKKKN